MEVGTHITYIIHDCSSSYFFRLGTLHDILLREHLLEQHGLLYRETANPIYIRIHVKRDLLPRTKHDRHLLQRTPDGRHPHSGGFEQLPEEAGRMPKNGKDETDERACTG